jgi:hypothetical protein
VRHGPQDLFGHVSLHLGAGGRVGMDDEDLLARRKK